jgi:hypothetical protein
MESSYVIPKSRLQQGKIKEICSRSENQIDSRFEPDNMQDIRMISTMQMSGYGRM